MSTELIEAPEHFVASFPVLSYSNKQVVRAGEALRGELVWTDATEDHIREVFRIASNWRESHAYPMRSVRHEVIAKMKRLGLAGITAARLKRMTSIRKKLREQPHKLNQIQDLGGCRAVLSSINDVRTLIEEIKSSTSHEIRDEYPYIDRPKIGGYRSHHLVLRFGGQTDSGAYSGRRIELQIRTRLQHSWATAVESVGLMRREDMKGGHGHPDWLRLFELMSAEFARAEGSPEAPNVPERGERVKEIRDLDRRLHAASTLERIRYVIRHAESASAYRQLRPEYYRIAYDHEAKTVEVKEYYGPKKGMQDYEQAELSASMAASERINTVFVEADRIEDLAAAYPNYFGDVQYFTKNLTTITRGGEAEEYTMPPKQRKPRPPYEPADLSWFRPGTRRRW